jgi:hypothetical protein
LAEAEGKDGPLERDGFISYAASPDLWPGSSPSSLTDEGSITENGSPGKTKAQPDVARVACEGKGEIFRLSQ